MKIRVGVVLKFEHADKLTRLLGINGVEVAEYHPIYEVPWFDGSTSRHDTFEKAVEAYAMDAKHRANTTAPVSSENEHGK